MVRLPPSNPLNTNARAFYDAAGALDIELLPDIALPWLTRHGHLHPLVQAGAPAGTLTAMDAILTALGGDAEVLRVKTRGSMQADFLVADSGVHVEYDEVQHFTSARLVTLGLYPLNVALAFEPSAYASIVEKWTSKGDRSFAHKQAAEFAGRGGRQRQRAYFDAFRDLVAPLFGNGPLLRIADPTSDHVSAALKLRALL